MISKAGVLEAFETRFDFQSARAVFGQALAAAGLAEQARYEPADIEALANALSAMELGRVDGVIAALTGKEAAPPAGQPAAAPAPAPKASEPEPEPEPESADADAAAGDAQEAKADDEAAAPSPVKKAAPAASQAKGAQKKKKK